jgi:hypothetical protein
MDGDLRALFYEYMVPLAEVFHMPPRVAERLTVAEFAGFAKVIDRRVAEHSRKRG